MFSIRRLGASCHRIGRPSDRTVIEIEDSDGARTQFEARDFLILANELILEGQIILPQRGDRIQEVQAGKTFLYEVLAPGKEPCWRYNDPFRKTLRVHTTQISVEEN